MKLLQSWNRRRTDKAATSSAPGETSVALSTSVSMAGWIWSTGLHGAVWGILAITVGTLSNPSTPEPSLPNRSGSLGDADVAGDLPRFEIAGASDLTFEVPAGDGEIQGLGVAESMQAFGGLESMGDASLQIASGSERQGNAGESGDGLFLRIPRSGLAVTKGSFTAFTLPAMPKPKEAYSIVIEVRLPPEIQRYRVSDLSGHVKGSDKYSQKLPYDPKSPSAAGYPVRDGSIRQLDASTVLDVHDNKVQIVVKVPGAARLVRDEIQIRSKRLREEQTLVIVFGQ